MTEISCSLPSHAGYNVLLDFFSFLSFNTDTHILESCRNTVWETCRLTIDCLALHFPVNVQTCLFAKTLTYVVFHPSSVWDQVCVEAWPINELSPLTIECKTKQKKESWHHQILMLTEPSDFKSTWEIISPLKFNREQQQHGKMASAVLFSFAGTPSTRSVWTCVCCVRKCVIVISFYSSFSLLRMHIQFCLTRNIL